MKIRKLFKKSEPRNQEPEIISRKNASKKMIKLGLALGVIFLTLFLLVGYVQLVITSPNSDNPETTEFIIKSGQGLETISKNLEEAELINNNFIFALYLKYEGQSGNILAGEYEIARNLNMVEVANIITKGNIVSQRVTFPEGWTNEAIAERLEENNIVTKSDFLTATNLEYDYWFLADKPEGAGLEGYLFPDTYEFRKNVTAKEIVKMMLDNFDRKYTSELRQKTEESDFKVHQVITLASVSLKEKWQKLKIESWLLQSSLIVLILIWPLNLAPQFNL
jgi:UPF0755 protein